MSLLFNTATAMVYSLFGPYLNKKICIGFDKIAFLDGAVDAFAYIIKMMSGVASDFFINRKIFLLIGGFCLFIAKPFEAVATTYWTLAQAKLLERFGNGLQSSPRDALIGDWAPSELKSTCFGIKQAGAAFGTAIGAIIAAWLMKISCNDYQFVFWMSAIPSFLAILIIIFYVSDCKYKISDLAVIQENNTKQHRRRKIIWSDISNLSFQYWMVIIVVFFVMSAKVTESLVIIHIATKLKLPEALAPIVMLAYGLANSFVSIPAGIIADKIKNKNNILIFAVMLLLLADIIFIFGNNIFIMLLGMCFLGSCIGIENSIFPVKIVNIVPVDLKGTGLGIFNLVCALGILIGATIIGKIAAIYSMNSAIFLSFGIGAFAIIMLFFLTIIEKRFLPRKI